MLNRLFLLEQCHELTKSNQNCLRMLYLPLIGSEPIILYQLLHDLSENKLKNAFNFQELANMMQINLDIIETSLTQLEAVGLIKRYIKNQDATYLITLEQPLSINKFNKNALLKNHLIKKIGIKEYEAIYYTNSKKLISKNGYSDISKKYQEIFSDNFSNHIDQEEESFYSTMDLDVSGFNSLEENIKNLPASHFIKKQLNRNPTFSENMMISALLNLGFHDAAINLLIDFSIQHNQQIVINYINKIAFDFASRSIISFQDVVHELASINVIKKQKIKNSLNNHINYKYQFDSKAKNSLNFKNEASVQNLDKLKDKISEIQFNNQIHDILTDEDIEEMF